MDMIKVFGRLAEQAGGFSWGIAQTKEMQQMTFKHARRIDNRRKDNERGWQMPADSTAFCRAPWFKLFDMKRMLREADDAGEGEGLDREALLTWVATHGLDSKERNPFNRFLNEEGRAEKKLPRPPGSFRKGKAGRKLRATPTEFISRDEFVELLPYLPFCYPYEALEDRPRLVGELYRQALEASSDMDGLRQLQMRTADRPIWASPESVVRMLTRVNPYVTEDREIDRGAAVVTYDLLAEGRDQTSPEFISDYLRRLLRFPERTLMWREYVACLTQGVTTVA
ncbi:unnamed protein product [Vitrella brassicaformis CCMP3155]|uniref:Uncharacterized protein n=2 Tax=Vitrella brassicaformis TaxID=1169539 RepID=A0A0G4ELP6_VITBC|nr:unnamed protein product [Vitrella brassicaformis CCMP3155]|eukprot:CEL98036.1 unnamed protein product [Vitrella brassicaformis CCMP3155]